MVLAPYAVDHQDPNGAGDARPTALKVIRDQELDGRLGGTVFFVTGGTSGLGHATVRALHATAADVYFTCRDSAKGEEVVNTILRDGKPGKVGFVEMELDSLASVRAGAAALLRKSNKLNVLICNAGES
jgi:NAD(P)-dependent dehydrogenase (short-subunit alcohol dehydrogenase family)